MQLIENRMFKAFEINQKTVEELSFQLNIFTPSLQTFVAPVIVYLVRER